MVDDEHKARQVFNAMLPRHEYYRLEGKEAVPCDASDWVVAFKANRRVALDDVNGWRVSTVFLGLNHQYGDGPPMIFETLATAITVDGEYMERYSTWDDAEAGHEDIVERIKQNGRL